MISLGNHHSNIVADSDDEPACIRALTDAQKERLGVLLEEYLQAMEAGLPPSVEQMTASMPELYDPLRVCVAGLESLHRMAGGRSAPVDVDVQLDKTSHRLGDFVLHETIGRGGMGVVYRATQTSLHRTVAVKVLPLAAVLDPRQRTRFQLEAEAAASLQHPNIVPVFAIGCERGVHFYAMRYIDGQSLGDWIDGHDATPTNWPTVVRYAIQVADGMQAAHEFGIVHRDIKPSNLLLDGNDNVWITDFGLARMQTDVSLTGSGDIVGTMRYMSPEQARGDSAIVDGRTDVYSLAATLYEMLTLRPAHEGDDATVIRRQMTENAIKPLRQCRNDVPRDLETVIAKAMATSRDGRYDTAAEFAADLRRVIAGLPTSARPPSPIDRAVTLAARYRTAALVTLLVGVLAIIGFAIGTTLLAAEKRVSDALAKESQQNEAIAREAVDRLGGQISELLADIPAASSVRRRLLSETLDYYERIADASADQDLAILYGKIGVLQGELGQWAQSLASLQKSQRIYSELASQTPDDGPQQLRWSISQNNLAQRFAQAGDLTVAAEWFGKAIQTQTRLQTQGHAGASVELATTLSNLAGMLSDTQRVNQSREAYTRAIALLENMPDQSRLLSTIQSNLAGTIAKHDPREAAELARHSLQYQVAQLEADAGNPKLATEVMLTLSTLATAQSQLGHHADATASLEQAVQIGQQLHTRWPDQPAYRRDLVLSLNHLGLSLSVQHRLDEASTALTQAIEHGRSLDVAFADSAEVQSMLGGVLNNLAFLKHQRGDAETAKRLYDEAIEHQQIAVRLAPQIPRYRTLLRTQQTNLRKLRGES